MHKTHNEDAQAGYTLLEVVCVMAMIGMLVAVLLPRVPLATSRPRLEAYAVEISTLLKADRNAAVASHRAVATVVDARDRLVSAGASNRVVRIPSDVVFEALLPRRCNGRPALSTIDFFGNGISCGGVIRLARAGGGYEIRVNWLTGTADIVAHNTF